MPVYLLKFWVSIIRLGLWHRKSVNLCYFWEWRIQWVSTWLTYLNRFQITLVWFLVFLTIFLIFLNFLFWFWRWCFFQYAFEVLMLRPLLFVLLLLFCVLLLIHVRREILFYDRLLRLTSLLSRIWERVLNYIIIGLLWLFNLLFLCIVIFKGKALTAFDLMQLYHWYLILLEFPILAETFRLLLVLHSFDNDITSYTNSYICKIMPPFVLPNITGN